MKLLNKLKISLLITFFIIILFNLKCLAVTGVITEITVNMRKEPSTDSKRIMYVTQDYKVEVLEKVGEWYKIKYNGVTGYVFAKYVDVDESKLETKKEDTTTTKENTATDVKNEENTDSNIQDVTTDAQIELQIKNETKVRLIPNITSNAIYTSNEVISITVIEQIGNWSYIYVDKIYGWVRTDDIVEENSISQDTTSNEDNKGSEQESEKVEITERKVAYVKYDNVNLRKKASTSSTILSKLKLNNEVIILEEVSSKWTKVEYDGTVGYVSADLLSIEKQEQNKEEKNEEKVESTEKKVAYIKYDTVNLRKKASTSSNVLAKLKLNNEVIILEEVSSKWTKVEYDGIVGYVSADLLANDKQEENIKEETSTSRDGEITSREEEISDKQEETKLEEKVEESVKEETTPEKETSTNTDVKEETETPKEEDKKTETNSKTKGEEIAEYAQKYVGYKYVLGGTSPKNGFDCSGLTYYVYKQFGYTISRSSRTQAKDGKEVSKDELQPGDLLIFKNQSLTAIGHVGIYIGNNKMVHASEPGIGVVITDLDAKGYNYNKRYVTARRIV